MSAAEQQLATPLTNQRFTSTHWSVVLAAQGTDSSQAAEWRMELNGLQEAEGVTKPRPPPQRAKCFRPAGCLRLP